VQAAQRRNIAGTLRHAGLAVSLLLASAAPAPARAGTPAESPADLKLEALIQPIEPRLRLGQIQEAMAIYATRVDWEGRLLSAWTNPDAQGALETFHILLSQEGPRPWAYAGIARVYLHWRIWDQADAALARATQLNPSVATFWVMKGDLDRLRGQPTRAREAYLKALELHPSPAAHDGLGLLAVSAGRADDARV